MQRLSAKQVRPHLGLALSGGGMRGFFHLGVLQVMEEEQIPIDIIAGTSAGAIAAALWACGYTADDMIELIASVNFKKMLDIKIAAGSVVKHAVKGVFSGGLRFWPLLPKGLLNGRKLEKFFNSLCEGKTLRDTKLPLAVTAVDLDSADTIFFTTPVPGHRLILHARYYHNVSIAEAVRCSISIPGIFMPKKFRGMALVDGAVKNNLPTDILHHMGAKHIVAVDVGFAGNSPVNTHSLSNVLLRSIDIMGREVTLLKAEQYADVIIRPEEITSSAKTVADLSAAYIEAGVNSARRCLPALRQLLNQN